MTDTKTVMVLGGGIGGVVAASELRKRLPQPHRVVLIDRERDHLFQPSLLWLMIGRRSVKQISRPLARLKKKDIEVVTGNIQAILPREPSVVVDGKTLKADYLVIALGAELVPQLIPGLEQAGHNLYSLKGARGLNAALPEFRSGRVVVMTAAPVYKCPAAPYEAAMLIDGEFRKKGVRDNIEMSFYAAEPGPMGVAGPEVSAGVKGMLTERGIDYHPQHQVKTVDGDAGKITFMNGIEAAFDLLVYVPPHQAPFVVGEASLVGESGWVTADRETLATSFAGVYAIGDIISLPLAMGKPLPKAGVFAHGEAEVVAKNIASEIAGQEMSATFTGHGACFIEAGGVSAGFGSGNFFAEPLPRIGLHSPNWFWHMGKVLYERFWLWKWF